MFRVSVITRKTIVCADPDPSFIIFIYSSDKVMPTHFISIPASDIEVGDIILSSPSNVKFTLAMHEAAKNNENKKL